MKKKKTSPRGVNAATAANTTNAANPTAFQLGFLHGYEKARHKKAGAFALRSTATSYETGYAAGRARRQADKDAE